MMLQILKILSPVAYLCGFIFFFLHFDSRRLLYLAIARYVEYAAIVLHLGFVLVLAVGNGHLPLAGPFQALTSFMLLFAILNKFIIPYRQTYSMAVIYTLILFILQTIAVLFISEQTVLPKILEDITFEVHVLLNLTGYAALSSSFAVSVTYLLLYYEINRNKLGYFYDRLPSLANLENLNFRALLIGFIFISAGIITGAYIGLYAWGTYWQWDPKLVAALIAWFIFCIAIIGKARYHWNGKRISFLSLMGFIWVLFSMLIITRYFSGIHSFE
jgi:ABC-type transport system involved in cytochrome c biogenesis permease subunit